MVDVRCDQEAQAATAEIQRRLVVDRQGIADREVGQIGADPDRAADRLGVGRLGQEVVQGTALVALEVRHHDVAQPARVDDPLDRLEALVERPPEAGLDQCRLVVVDDEEAVSDRRAGHFDVHAVDVGRHFSNGSHGRSPIDDC